MTVALAQHHHCLSRALLLPGFALASRAAWLFLEIDELAPVADRPAWFAARMHVSGANAFSRCATTEGFANALAAGDPAVPSVVLRPRRAVGQAATQGIAQWQKEFT